MIFILIRIMRVAQGEPSEPGSQGAGRPACTGALLAEPFAAARGRPCADRATSPENDESLTRR